MGCGDWQFSRLIDWSGMTYDGFDVVDSVIAINSKKYALPNVRFHAYTGNPKELPSADLLIAKDVLQHLSNDAIGVFIAEMKKYKFVLLTNCIRLLDFSFLLT